MALQKNFEKDGMVSFHPSDGGEIVISSGPMTFENVYVVVHDVRATKLKCTATVHFRAENGEWTKTYNFAPSVDQGSTNFIKQAYEHLKTLPEFAGATDI